MRKGWDNFVAGWREARWIYLFSIYLLLFVSLITSISYAAGRKLDKPTTFDLVLALVAGCISFYLAKVNPVWVYWVVKWEHKYSGPVLLLVAVAFNAFFILIIVGGALSHSAQRYSVEFIDLVLIMAGIVLTHVLSLHSQFYRESQGYMLRAARRIWVFLLSFFMVEWAVGVLLFYLIVVLLQTSVPSFVVAFIIGIIVAAIPKILESILLPKKATTVKTLERPLTRLLLKLNVAPGYNFAWAIEYLREQDLFDCQQPYGWGLNVPPVEIGRRIRKLYEFCKYRIAEERHDPSLLYYDVGRTPWDQFYLLTRHVGRKLLRQYIINPVTFGPPDWDGRERRRKVGTRADRDPSKDPDPSRGRMYDDTELIKRIVSGHKPVSPLVNEAVERIRDIKG